MEEWVPVVISTLLIAIFAEILPQWLIPRHAVSWGYYCWPLIWGCMWLTAIVSFPLAWLLDNLGAGRKEVLDVFTNEQLGVIIKYHERSERRGGNLSPDATRIILGMLGPSFVFSSSQKQNVTDFCSSRRTKQRRSKNRQGDM